MNGGGGRESKWVNTAELGGKSESGRGGEEKVEEQSVEGKKGREGCRKGLSAGGLFDQRDHCRYLGEPHLCTVQSSVLIHLNGYQNTSVAHSAAAAL